MTSIAAPAAAPTTLPVEHVVLLDDRGRASGLQAKADAHGPDTRLHLAFSCHVVRADGRVLVTRRALDKLTWPGVWTNACCGHPQLGETLGQAVLRRLRQELGVVPEAVGVALPDFTYRAAMDDGTVEHELCPVLVARVDDEPSLDPAEVDDVEWVPWDDLVARARTAPDTLSPWSVEQILRLADLAPSPSAWLESDAHRGAALLAWQPGLETPDSPGGLTCVVAGALPGRRATAPPAGGQGTATAPAHVAGAAAAAPSAPALDRGAGVDPRVVGPLAPVAQPLDALLQAFVDERRPEVVGIDPTLAEVVDEIGGLVAAGGKRLRPAYVYWGHRATGADHDPEVLLPAGAVELLHTFALLHDDVMDRSVSRRGRPAAHAALAARHRAEARSGDSDWFGVSGAILAGDLTFVWADELFDATALPAGAMVTARRVFTTLRSEVIAGQYLDLALAADPAALGGGADRGADPSGRPALRSGEEPAAGATPTTIDLSATGSDGSAAAQGAAERAAAKVALLKTARYTVTRPLQLGAALAGRPVPEVEAALQTYGDAVGVAFQMRDDVLGLFGDPAETGKGVVEDLREGKRTLLLLRALRLATPAQRAVLHARVGDPHLDEAGAARVQEVVAATGALASVEALITAQHALARSALASVPEPARQALDELAALAIERRA